MPSTDANAVYTETLTLVACRPEGGDVSTYIFRPANPVSFVAGQYAHVRMVNMPLGTRRVRELSFASAPQDEELWFGVDARSGSDYQRSLQVLVPGDKAELFKIRGHLTWPPSIDRAIMIGGGVGVTPFRSMLRDARHGSLPIKTTIVQVSSGPFLYATELAELAQSHFAIRRSQIDETLARLASQDIEAHYYIAGSKDFVRKAASDLKALGVQKIESDEFKGVLPE